jgi:periplasmic divalent cation tolerance protein
MRLVLCDCPADRANDIAREVIDQRLAATATILSGVERLVRRGQGVHTEQLSLLLLQTNKGRLQDLIETLVRLHPSKTPPVISLSIIEGNVEYMQWAENMLGTEG